MKKITIIVSFFSLMLTMNSCSKEDDNNNDDNNTTTKYNCVSGTCTENANGQYTSLQNCEDNCSSNNTGAYDCVSGNCETSSNGQYATLSDCQASCSVAGDDKYDCVSGNCEVAANGAFSSLADCQSNCSQTTNDTTLTISGTVYDLVTIGTQVWMAENLNVETSGVCYDETQDCDQYGRLYTIGQALSLCPSGWRIPTKADFEALITELGGATVAGGKLKSTTLWNSPNTGATNESGFNALPSGTGLNPNDFGGGPIQNPQPNEYQDQGNLTSFWTSTTTSPGSDFYYIFTLTNNSAAITEEDGSALVQYKSCRCIQE